MSEKIKYKYNTQNTVRLTDVELQFIDENYIRIVGHDNRLPIAEFVMTSVTNAASNLKPKEITKEVSKQSDLDIIEELKQEVESLKKDYDTVEKSNDDFLVTISELIKAQVPEGVISLNFSPEWRKYIWGVLEICKLKKYAVNYEELIMKIFANANKRNELVLTEADYTKLDTIPYDLEIDPHKLEQEVKKVVKIIPIEKKKMNKEELEKENE